MPSLRISFPETDSPSVVALRGQRITVGRLPQNTIQIRDRTISAYHAELLAEDDHYRLHDLGATNGVLVNGEPVTDFHLREACKVTFGGVECEFSPEVVDETQVDPSRALMTRAESEALHTKNDELEQTIVSLREQLNAFRPAEGEENAVNRDLILAEVASLKESLAGRDRDIQHLKSDLAVLQRDRTNLQRALREAQAKPEPEVSQPAPVEEPKVAAAVPAASSAPAEPTTPVEEPSTKVVASPLPPKPAPWTQKTPTQKPASLPKPSTPLPHAAPASEPALAPSAVPAAVPVPRSKPAFPAAATAKPVAPAMPTAPAIQKAPGQLQPAASRNGAPAGNLRPAPVAKSPAAGTPGTGGAPQATPKPSLATRPPTAIAGPKGTQKIQT